jgi:polar amino acid transport system substrate-binding protein
MRSTFRLKASIVPMFALALVLAACGKSGSAGSTTGTATTGGPSTTSGASPTLNVPLKNAGVLTIGACIPAPGFEEGTLDDPKGFEVDIVNEIAKRLNIPQTKWIAAPFNSIFKPGPTQFDFDINEITITDERSQVVDFSVPYFDANQGMLVRSGTPIANAKTVADLKGYQLGGQASTTGLAYIKDTIKPDKAPREYNTTNDAAHALAAGQIDGFVMDVPISIALTKQFPGTVVIGQFITNEQYGILFQKGSELKAAVDQVLSAMKADGTLAALQNKWFPGSTDLPTMS